MRRWAPWLAILAGLGGCGGPDDRPLPPGEVARYARCDGDADCVVVLNGCCCELAAIHRARVDEFREHFRCEDSCTCEPRPVAATCEANACTLVIDR